VTRRPFDAVLVVAFDGPKLCSSAISPSEQKRRGDTGKARPISQSVVGRRIGAMPRGAQPWLFIARNNRCGPQVETGFWASFVISDVVFD
jgi:hypothetical protein